MVLYKIHQGHTPRDTTNTSRWGSTTLTTALATPLSRPLTRSAHIAGPVRAGNMAMALPRPGLQNLGPGAPAPSHPSNPHALSSQAFNLLQVLGALGPQLLQLPHQTLVTTRGGLESLHLLACLSQLLLQQNGLPLGRHRRLMLRLGPGLRL